MGKAAAKKKTVDYALRPLARRAAAVRVKFKPSWPVPAIEAIINAAEKAASAEQRADQAERKVRRQQKVDPAANWKKFLNTGRVTGKQDKTLLHTVGIVYKPIISNGDDSKREAAIRGYINRTISLMYQGGWFAPEKNALIERAFGKPTV